MEITTEVIANVEINLICARCNNKINGSYDREFGDLEVQFCEHCKQEIVKEVEDTEALINEVISQGDNDKLDIALSYLKEIKDIIY